MAFIQLVRGGDAPLILPSAQLSAWNFHNCILSYYIALQSTTLSYPFTSSHQLGLINATFTISTTGQATFRIACDTPLNISSISIAAGYFQELVRKYSSDKCSTKSIYIKTIEFNKDYRNLRLDGVNCITIDNLCAQFKLYQKKLSLRLEHKTKVDFSVQTLTDMLCSNPNTLNMEAKINALTKAVGVLMDSNYKTNKLLMAMLPMEANK